MMEKTGEEGRRGRKAGRVERREQGRKSGRCHGEKEDEQKKRSENDERMGRK